MFPELRIGRDYFEDLTYDRINIAKTLLQLSGARYLDDVRIPPEIPCNVYVGLQDNLLNMHTEEGRKAYHQRILSMIPHAHIVEGNYDHYGQGPEHNTGISSLTDDMAASEKHAIPAPHFATVEQPRRVPR